MRNRRAANQQAKLATQITVSGPESILTLHAVEVINFDVPEIRQAKFDRILPSQTAKDILITSASAFYYPEEVICSFTPQAV